MAYFNCPHCGGFGCVFCDLRARIDRAQGDAVDRFLDQQRRQNLFDPTSLDRLRQDPAIRTLIANAIVHGQLLERDAQRKPSITPAEMNMQRFDLLEVREDAEEGERREVPRRRKQAAAAGA